ncbi:MAG: hypothetical protein AAGD35_06800 [Actinomycetota bacterium]
MAEKIPARFRKTKTDKWAVMAPVADLEKALAEGGKVDVLKKSGDWSTFVVASLGRPFDVDGVEMCYGYGPEEEGEGGDRPATGGGGGAGGGRGQEAPPARGRRPMAEAPPVDRSEPMPEYQGGAEDEWSSEF